MVVPLQFLTALVCFSVPVSASAGDILPAHPKEPKAIIFERKDHGGMNSIAKAKVIRESAVDWCGNWKPGDPAEACADEIMESEAGRVYEASANCHSGELISISGHRYFYDGLWRNTDDGMWDGWAKSKISSQGRPLDPRTQQRHNACCSMGRMGRRLTATAQDGRYCSRPFPIR